MNAMTSAEKQKAYRERQKVKAIAEEHFDSQQFVTIEAFLEAVEFDQTVFFDELKGLGEETNEFKEEREEVYRDAYDTAFQAAYDTAFQNAYEVGLQEAVASGDFDPQQDSDDFIREEADGAAKEEADEAAKEEANEAVDEWEASQESYESTCVEYSLVDLVAAYRAACTP